VLVATVATQVLVVLEEAPVLIILLSEGIGSALVLLRSSSFFQFFFHVVLLVLARHIVEPAVRYSNTPSYSNITSYGEKDVAVAGCVGPEIAS
jgi:hypothetical protein